MKIAPTLAELVARNEAYGTKGPEAGRELRALLAVARAAKLVVKGGRALPLVLALDRLEKVSKGGKP